MMKNIDPAVRRERQLSAKQYCALHPAKTVTIQACNVPGCLRQVASFSFCNKHYQEWLQYGKIIDRVLPEDLPGEEWLDAPDTDGLYLVSNYGRVKRKRSETARRGHKMEVAVKILKPDIDKKGYCRVHLGLNGNTKSMLVHRLVAKAFISNPGNKPQVNHIDGDPSNNAADNLEWCDQSYQEIHKHYVLGHGGGMYQSRRVKNISTGKLYPSIGSASRDSGVPIYTIFNRLQSSKPDPNGDIWRYVV